MIEEYDVGDRSPRIAEVRAILARLGLISGYERDLGGSSDNRFEAADTFYDEALVKAVQAFQQSRGILANGRIGEPTLKLLREATYSLGERELKFDKANELVGDDVAQLQMQLTELGFYAEKVDGHYGIATEQAVRTYQLNYGLDCDGVCGTDTVRALNYLGRRITGGNPHAIREREQLRQAGPKLSGKRLVIDPGLGGGATGAIVAGPWGAISEEELLWDLAQRIENRTTGAGMETIQSRLRHDNPTHAGRAEMANAYGADLMLCLRFDRYHNEKANGCATFYFGSEHGPCSLSGEHLSGLIQREIAARTGLTNCGIHARTWDMLRLTKMPTIEIVAGYLTNPRDVERLTTPAVRDAIAEAIVVAVKRFYLLDQDDMETGTYTFSDILRQELKN